MFDNIKQYFRDIKPIIWSHHPKCEKYINNSHTMTILGKELCIGCFVTYPTAVIMLLIGYLFHLLPFFSYVELFHIGFGLCSVYLFSILGFTKRKPIKIISKFFIGCGIAFCIAGIWETPLKLPLKIIFTYFYWIIGHLFLNSVRGYSIYKTCKKCGYQGKWRSCPGMNFVFNQTESDSNINDPYG